MKKYTYVLVFSVLALALVTPALAGGGFEDYTLNADGTVKSTNAEGAEGAKGEVMGATTDGTPVVYDEDGNVVDQGAEAITGIKALGTSKSLGLIAILVLIVGGIYFTYKKGQPKNL